jgi:hypothetical protein
MTYKDNQSTPLDKYKQDGKKLTPPLGQLGFKNASWIHERLPEMLWAGLIRERQPGNTGYAIFRDVMQWLGNNIDKEGIKGVTHTDIANFNPKLKEAFIRRVVDQAGTDTLKPLLLLPDLPAFEEWKAALGSIPSDENEVWTHLADAVSLILFHQSQEATDVRWVKLSGTILSGKMKFTDELRSTMDEINYYPNRGDQRKVRPSIRSMEIMENLQDSEYKWAGKFWDYCYENTRCIPEIDEDDKDAISKKYDGIGKDKKHYHAETVRIRQALIDHFFATSKTTKVDARHETVFGLTLYAFDVFVENNLLLTASTVNGRITTRIMLESYITLAYLMKKERDDDLLWDTYRANGTGEANLIKRHYEDNDLSSNMVNLETIGRIANEDMWSEFVPINLGDWDMSNLRKRSEEIGDKEIYNKFYPYTSGFVHANWNAVREASMQMCVNPLHRLHRIPSFGLGILPNVNEDCRTVLNKMLALLDEAYPDFKDRISQPSKESKKEYEEDVESGDKK